MLEKLGALRRSVWKKSRELAVGHCTYYRVHLSYFVCVIFLSSIVLWHLESDFEGEGMTYVDALFMAASAMTVTGLSVQDFSKFTGGSKALTMILIILGGHLIMTVPLVLIRRHYFVQCIEKNADDIANLEMAAQEKSAKLKRKLIVAAIVGQTEFPKRCGDRRPSDCQINPQESVDDLDLQGNGAHLYEKELEPNPKLERSEGNPTEDTLEMGDKGGLSVRHPSMVLSRQLSQEYRALNVLAIIVPLYVGTLQLLGFGVFVVYLHASGVETLLHKSEINGYFWALFHTVSSFNNAGLSLFEDNLEEFASSPFFLFLTSFLLVVGNTGFALILRFIIWLLKKITRDPSGVYQFILDNPRRCFTHLFPSKETKLLLLILIGIQFTEVVSFLVLDWHSEALKDMRPTHKMVIGFFQSISTRTAGFSALNIADLQRAMWVLYVAMMYISIYPITITLKNTAKTGDIFRAEKPIGRRYFWGHGRKLLLRDVTWIYLAIFFICAFEEEKLQKDSAFTIFHIVFEIISGYGNVGLSLHYQTLLTSFCARWYSVSKLVLVAIMILGRHRGLPDSVDHAVQLPRYVPPTDSGECQV